MKRIAAFTFLAGLLSLSATAETLDISWTGTKTAGELMTATGTGSITFADGLSSIALSDVTAFNLSLTLCECTPAYGAPDPPYYSEDDLTLKSITADVNAGQLDSLYLVGHSDWYGNFTIQGNAGDYTGDTDWACIGAVTLTPEVPEPLSMALVGCGLIAMWRVKYGKAR